MAWIESHQEIREHPKTVRLKRRLGVGLAATIGHLHLFWWWALSYAEDGDLARFEDEIIADACEWEGDAGEFVTALIASGFVNEDRTIHDWDHYTGRIRKQRQDNRIRQQRWRDNNAPVTRKQRDSGTHNALVTRDSPLDNPATGPDRTITGPDHTPPVVPPTDAGGDGGAIAPAPPKRGGKRPKTDPPEVLEPNEADYAAGARVGLTREQVNAKAAVMLDYHRKEAKSSADWHASLRTWLGNTPKFDAPRSPPNGRASPPRPDDYLPSTAHRAVSERF
ncbi:MAG: hypothetical protein AB7P40_00105 [Chloroflexota bacterium]